ncbi:hypothetical protein HDU96_002165, partial [Phlyctochytrium bullatum]
MLPSPRADVAHHHHHHHHHQQQRYSTTTTTSSGNGHTAFPFPPVVSASSASNGHVTTTHRSSNSHNTNNSSKHHHHHHHHQTTSFHLPSVGTLLKGPVSQYILREVKGKGSFSTVFLAQCVVPPSKHSGLRRGTRVAVKCIAKAVGNEAAVEAQRRECEFLRRLQPDLTSLKSKRASAAVAAAGLSPAAAGNTGVVGFYEMVETNDLLFFVLEYCPIDLYSAITQNGGFSLPVVKGLFPQIANAVQYCHDRGIYHRDLKPENILITSDFMIRLADFGLATDKPWSQEMGCGSVRYMAPECMGVPVPMAAPSPVPSPDRPMPGYAPAPNDVWALGVILINLVFARNPWHSPADPFCADAYLARREPVLVSEFNLSPEFDGVLRRCFDPNPETRATVVQLKNMVASVPRFVAAGPAQKVPVIQAPPAPRAKVSGERAKGAAAGVRAATSTGSVGRKSSVEYDSLSPHLPLTFLQMSLDATRSPSLASTTSSSSSTSWKVEGWDDEDAADIMTIDLHAPTVGPTPSTRRKQPPRHIDLPQRHTSTPPIPLYPQVQPSPVHAHPPRRTSHFIQPHSVAAFDDLDPVDDHGFHGHYGYLSPAAEPRDPGYLFDAPSSSSGRRGSSLNAGGGGATFVSGVSPPNTMDARMAALRIADNWTRNAPRRGSDGELGAGGGSSSSAYQPLPPSHRGYVPPGSPSLSVMSPYHTLLPTPTDEDGPAPPPAATTFAAHWSSRVVESLMDSASSPGGGGGLKKHSFDSGFESASSASAHSLPPWSVNAGVATRAAAAPAPPPPGSPVVARIRSPQPPPSVAGASSFFQPTPPMSPEAIAAASRVRRAQSDAVLAGVGVGRTGSPGPGAEPPVVHRFASFNYPSPRSAGPSAAAGAASPRFSEDLAPASPPGIRRNSTSSSQGPAARPSGDDLLERAARLRRALPLSACEDLKAVAAGGVPRRTRSGSGSSSSGGSRSPAMVPGNVTPPPPPATSSIIHPAYFSGTPPPAATPAPVAMVVADRAVGVRKLSIPDPAALARYAIIKSPGVSSDEEDSGGLRRARSVSRGTGSVVDALIPMYGGGDVAMAPPASPVSPASRWGNLRRAIKKLPGAESPAAAARQVLRPATAPLPEGMTSAKKLVRPVEEGLVEGVEGGAGVVGRRPSVAMEFRRRKSFMDI